ncbi:lytic transglycosylase domain-containing protein [Aromatoleum sp.]|uniref:lytic transglycosylase domain-containing protein n=1 Tax=Aromatoleum sp. TaxID=2307007 RepID=UPI0039C87BEA
MEAKRRIRSRPLSRALLGMALATAAAFAHAGNQLYEPLAASVRAALHSAVSDMRAPELLIVDPLERTRWLGEMSRRLEQRIPDRAYREDLLVSVHYEATRAGLDPQLVLGLVEVESAFRKYAVSSAGARGFMQVMPFWTKLIGQPDDNLFNLRTNLRYGCTILRHYLDIERGDLYRALGRYNGSLGKPEYPNMVRTAWERRWAYQPMKFASDDGRTHRN